MNGLLSKNIKYFIAVMEERNISHAAEKLHITRSPLGKAIVELEVGIGSKLFIRKGNMLEPTERAVQLYSQLKPVFENLLSIEEVFFYKKPRNRLRLYVDENYPYNLFHSVQSLQYIKGLRVDVEKRDFTDATLVDVLSDPRSAFLTLGEVPLQSNNRYPMAVCGIKNVYLLHANNKANYNKEIRDIVLDHVIIKGGSVPQKQFFDCLLFCVQEIPAELSIMDENIDLSSMLNLIGCGEAVSFVSESFLKFCDKNISSVLVDNVTMTPKLLCADNGLRYFDKVTEFIGNH